MSALWWMDTPALEARGNQHIEQHFQDIEDEQEVPVEEQGFELRGEIEEGF